jgi:dethiobiotin synthetase
MSALFVTATGTDIGKTFVTTGLIRHLRAAGHAVAAIKPVVSGFDPTRWEESDPAALLAALGGLITLEEIAGISPWRFAAPLSPHTAAQREDRAIAFQDVVAFCRRTMSATRGTLLIEGIGGVMVPLDDRHSVLDLMSLLRVPVLLVAGSYVGTLSHTFTALEVVARRNLDIAAVVVSESEGSAASLEDTIDSIRMFADSVDIVGIPRLPAGTPDHAAFAHLAAVL